VEISLNNFFAHKIFAFSISSVRIISPNFIDCILPFVSAIKKICFTEPFLKEIAQSPSIIKLNWFHNTEFFNLFQQPETP